MSIHREGTATLVISAVVLAVVNGLIYVYLPSVWLFLLIISIILYLFLISFFRKPDRTLKVIDDSVFISPCDGKVVVIEETEEPEFFQDKRLQVSIFMSPLNVHINWHPISGTIDYYKYHPGKYLAAWNPKSSTENERTSIGLTTESGVKILMRQIAGAVARRIAFYPEVGTPVEQGTSVGFIRFGSRVDMFLPLDAEINVKIGDLTLGGETEVATLRS